MFNIDKMYDKFGWMPGFKTQAALFVFGNVNSIPIFPHPSRGTDCTRKLKNVSDAFCAKLNRMCYYGVAFGFGSHSDVPLPAFVCVHEWSCLCVCCVTLSERYVHTF